MSEAWLAKAILRGLERRQFLRNLRVQGKKGKNGGSSQIKVTSRFGRREHKRSHRSRMQGKRAIPENKWEKGSTCWEK